MMFVVASHSSWLNYRRDGRMTVGLLIKYLVNKLVLEDESEVCMLPIIYPNVINRNSKWIFLAAVMYINYIKIPSKQ